MFEFKVDILDPLLLISANREVIVLLVEIVNRDKLVLVVVIKASCDVKVELIFVTDVFNVEILVVWLFNVASCGANVEFVALVNNVKFALVLLIKFSCDVNVKLIFDTEVFNPLIFKVLLSTLELKAITTASLVFTLCLMLIIRLNSY